MNNNINTLINSLSDLGKIRKADKNNGEYSSTSDNTMSVGTKRKIYHYFPKNKQQLQEIIAQRILEDGYECNLNDIDVRGVGEYMHGLFSDSWILGNFWSINGIDIRKFNGHIEEWDVHNVKNMGWMFKGCSEFDQDLSEWDVSNVRTMQNMFAGCSKFNKPLNNWDVSNVRTMQSMFYGCSSFNKPLNKWDVSNVKEMQYMFYGCSSFDQDISNWDVSNVYVWTSIFFNPCPIKEEYKPLKFR